MSNHTPHSETRITGTFVAPLFSPKGGIEGALLDAGDGIVQLTIDSEQLELSKLIAGLDGRQALIVDTESSPPPHKGEAAHAVRTLKRVLKVDGVDLADAAHFSQQKFRGKVARVHYARHGEANGVVLDSGDFIHLKPHGFKAVRVSVGDAIEAVGPAKPLVTGTGFVVEAQAVNGTPVAEKPKKPAR
jgi:hypothetical protein